MQHVLGSRIVEVNGFGGKAFSDYQLHRWDIHNSGRRVPEDSFWKEVWRRRILQGFSSVGGSYAGLMHRLTVH